ncbi:MAG: sulfite exporter TauE/SafE family protein [Elusimicrobia bacterium]|nr:sulfite exporter TauE/SafE family protein [Elusimicrobiota bacterium]
MGGALAQGFWLGLATGPYCFAACAPFLVPYLCAEGRPDLKGNLGILARFLAGRLLAYLLFGAGAGAMGAAVSGTVPVWLAPAALGLSALLMLACAAGIGTKLSWCAAAPGRVPFALGFLTGINVCPPFLTGLVVVLALGSAFSGAAFFAAFFAATSLYLLPVLGVWPWLSSSRARAAGRLALALAGLWYLHLAASLPWR